MRTVFLDSAEHGKVEEVYVKDGATVAADQLLYRLSNPERRLNLLARESEVAQQAATLASMHVTTRGAMSSRARQITQLEYDVQQAQKMLRRDELLAAKGFISSAKLEEDRDLLASKTRALAEERSNGSAEVKAEQEAIESTTRVLSGLQSDLNVSKQALDSLSVRAPMGGRLTDFQLQLGQTVSPGTRLGRIDDPTSIKLVASVDEFYIAEVQLHRPGRAVIGDKSFDVSVSRVSSQVKDGRFPVELTFSGDTPMNLPPGLTVETKLVFGIRERTLILPAGPYLADSGGGHVYVMSPDGTRALRRAITIGQKTPFQVEVLGGLAPGEEVIVSSYDAFKVADHIMVSD